MAKARGAVERSSKDASGRSALGERDLDGFGEHAVETQTFGSKVRSMEVCLGDWFDLRSLRWPEVA
jgi:hypothetical protein